MDLKARQDKTTEEQAKLDANNMAWIYLSILAYKGKTFNLLQAIHTRLGQS
jgi:hypothetical protein